MREEIQIDNDRYSATFQSQPEILFISSFPPRECGIATYSQDLIKALDNKFINSFSISVCALENENEKHEYDLPVKYKLDTSHPEEYVKLAMKINRDDNISIVLVQHEFGFFYKNEEHFQEFLETLNKPIVTVFHTVLPSPDEIFKSRVKKISDACQSIIVMTNNSAKLLVGDYDIPKQKIRVIPHGTHLVPHLNKKILKEKYSFSGKKILSTFGLLSSGKSIETTIEALPAIIRKNPDVLFLVIGKTHPHVIKNDGEQYRRMLEERVAELKIQDHVRFVNRYLQLPDLLEYLQMTDIYLFTSKDPNQAVSGTFSYAMSSGCPIISTPIPHVVEVLRNDAGIVIDFENPRMLSAAVNRLLEDNQLRKNISLNGLHRIASTAWENSAVAHAKRFEKISGDKINLRYRMPSINLNHVIKLTTDLGMIQFSKLNHPDISSGYTLDDNARALVAMCAHFEATSDASDLIYIRKYLSFIKLCQQPNGNFLNYLDSKNDFTEQNQDTNLEDSNGRAIWTLGYLISNKNIFPADLISEAELIMQNALLYIEKIHSTRAMAFVIKGLYYANLTNKIPSSVAIIKTFADRLVQMYRHESRPDWKWFESYLTYANSVIPEALLCAFETTNDTIYYEIAKTSFDFLLSHTFNENGIKVISNQSWLKRGENAAIYGEQPIDVAYTILALARFYRVSNKNDYLRKMKIAFTWFLGNNHLKQIIYNPCTGGCYDGLEESHVNLNQGAESTVSYLMARLTIEKYYDKIENKVKRNQKVLA